MWPHGTTLLLSIGHVLALSTAKDQVLQASDERASVLLTNRMGWSHVHNSDEPVGRAVPGGCTDTYGNIIVFGGEVSGLVRNMVIRAMKDSFTQYA